MVLGSIQPSYLTWLPFFERMICSDVFVYLDDVEYSKNSFHNRNKIKTPDGTLTLTVPVLYKGNSKSFINQIKIDYSKKWNVKHWKSIEINYRRASFFNDIAPEIKKILLKEWSSLGDLNIAIIEKLRIYLGISTICYRSSELKVKGNGNDKLVNICKKLNATKFIVKTNTENYHPKSYFKDREIDFEYFVPQNKEYPQLHGSFTQGLSALDMAMNCGANSFYNYYSSKILEKHEDWQYRSET